MEERAGRIPLKIRKHWYDLYRIYFPVVSFKKLCIKNHPNTRLAGGAIQRLIRPTRVTFWAKYTYVQSENSSVSRTPAIKTNQ